MKLFLIRDHWHEKYRYFWKREIVYLRMAANKFLVVQQKMIGDVLASTIICECLKSKYPNCIIHFVANRNTLPVLKNNPHINRIIVFEKAYRSNKLELYTFLKSIRKEHYYGVIDAYGKLESNLISLFSKAQYKVSHTKWYTRWIYTDTVKENLNANGEIPLAFQNRLQLLNPFLGRINDYNTYPKIYLSEKESKDAQIELNQIKDHENQKLIMISILGSSKMKTYPSEYMAEVLDLICTRTDVKLLFNYIPDQKKDVLEIYEKCKKETKAKIAIDFYAESLRRFLALVSHCNALVGNEGGAVNMAKALDIPTFCVFSPFIIKGAWHTKNSQKHVAVHLQDFKPMVFDNLDKIKIKKNIDTLYTFFEPTLFKDSLVQFLDKNLYQKEVLL